MLRSSFPQRAVWPRLLPGFSPWSGVVGVLSSVISVIVIGISDLNWWAKAGIIFILLVVPIIGYAILKRASIIWQRVKQYDLLYDELERTVDELERTVSDIQQLQENLRLFIQNLRYAGLQVFEVTAIQWSNPSPFLVIACNQNLPLGSKLVVINVSNLDALGQFAVEQTTSGGYFVREDRIFNAVWWGFLHNQVAQHAHSRIDGTVAVLLR
jgi:hypothetical protein